MKIDYLLHIIKLHVLRIHQLLHTQLQLPHLSILLLKLDLHLGNFFLGFPYNLLLLISLLSQRLNHLCINLVLVFVDYLTVSKLDIDFF